MFLKVKAKETKGERGTVFFQTVVSLICTFFKCKSYAHLRMYIFSKIIYVSFFIYSCLVYHLYPSLYLPAELVRVLCVSASVPVPLSICLPLF